MREHGRREHHTRSATAFRAGASARLTVLLVTHNGWIRAAQCLAGEAASADIHRQDLELDRAHGCTAMPGMCRSSPSNAEVTDTE